MTSIEEAMSLRSALRRIYDSSSVPVQTQIRMVYGRLPARWKLGADYQAYCEDLLRNDRRTREELDDLQLDRLRLMIEHCYEKVPFYRKEFARVGFKPEQFRTLDDLRRIPVLRRQDLRHHYHDLKAVDASRYRPEASYSGGSTGEPVKFLLDRKAIALEKACIRRHWLRAGYNEGEPSATLRGLMLAVQRGEFWVVDKGENCLYLSSYHLTGETIGPFVKAINAFRPSLLNCYASSAWLLATLAEEAGLVLYSPRSIVCASETLHAYQRTRIESVFKAKIWDWYGLTELVGNASQCERHDGYHVSMEQGCFEVLDEQDRPVKPGGIGEIVATGLHNFSMPLLRYRTGDLAEATDERCGCGRGSRIIKSIQGRITEHIETESGVRLSATALNVHGGTWKNVTQFQYVQKSRRQVILRVVRGAGYTEADERRILSDMAERFGDEIQLGIEYASQIPKSARGKTPLIVKETEQAL
jgi:phenylacetate-CoA ligase